MDSGSAVSDVELLGLRIDKNGSALWTIPAAEKRLNANMKNRIETAKLKMYYNTLEKGALRSKFLIEKEKREAVSVLQKTIETSGVSVKGISPEAEEGELLEELKVHFKNGMHLSTKRLAKWKLAERQVSHIITLGREYAHPSNNPLISEGKRQVEKFAIEQLIRHLANDTNKQYDIVYNSMPSDISKKKDMKEVEKISLGLSTVNSETLDVFTCLKSNPDSKFSVDTWQSQTSENYTRSAGLTRPRINIQNNKSLRAYRRPFSAYIGRRHQYSVCRPKSAPLFQKPLEVQSKKQHFKHTGKGKLNLSFKNNDTIETKDSYCSKDICELQQKANIESEKLSNEKSKNDNNDAENKIEDTTFRIIPHWKKDLLREAPIGLFSKREQVKVNIHMSKAKRTQELDKMVQNHVYDPKAIARREHIRRQEGKLHLYMTLLSIQNNINKIQKF